MPGAQRASGDIGHPSRLIVPLCGKQTASDSLGAIVGRVRGADSHLPVPGANVVITWLQVVIANAELHSTPRTEKAVTDIDGVYRICGLPGADTLFAAVELGAQHTGTISVGIPAGAVTRRDFTIGDSSSTVAVVLDSTSGEELRRLTTVMRGSSILEGIVHGDKDKGKGLLDAGISVSGTGLTATTDATGHYKISGLPAGTFNVEARAIGRQPRTEVVNLASGSPASIDFTLDKPLQELSRITIYGKVPKRRRDIEEFQKRKASGLGHYLSANDLEHAFSVSSAIRMVPGVREIPSGRFDHVIVMHSNKCPATVLIDGIRINTEFESIDDIPPNQIAGIEIYSDALETPAQLSTISGCGVIAIWRKW